ncbi:NUDIX hydrolase [candidate division KSB1 bacterium]|nr:NUDIX hydrolase [candidate division KSB1 bacterium]
MTDSTLFQTEQAEQVFETRWFSIEKIPNRLETENPYYRLSCDDSVEILALTPDKQVLMVLQFRPAVSMPMLELPAGHVDPGETPEQAVQRELEEETGYACEWITYLGPHKIAASRINSTLHLYFGHNAYKIIGECRKHEKVDAVLMPLDEFRKRIQEGQYLEMSGIATYCLANLAGFVS